MFNYVYILLSIGYIEYTKMTTLEFFLFILTTILEDTLILLLTI